MAITKKKEKLLVPLSREQPSIEASVMKIYRSDLVPVTRKMSPNVLIQPFYKAFVLMFNIVTYSACGILN